MLKKLTFVLIALAFAASASAGTLTKDGLVIPGTGENVTIGDRIGLINDGSFENGICDDGSSDWTCTSNTTCFWILDPIPIIGYPAYDGVQVAWLGGFCGTPNSNTFCQSIFVDGMYLDFYWMGHDGSDGVGGGYMYVSFDGNVAFDHVFVSPDDHTFGSWNSASSFWGMIDVSAFCGATHELCLGWIAPADGSNDNFFTDYVTLEEPCGTAAETTTFSNVKSLY